MARQQQQVSLCSYTVVARFLMSFLTKIIRIYEKRGSNCNVLWRSYTTGQCRSLDLNIFMPW